MKLKMPLINKLHNVHLQVLLLNAFNVHFYNFFYFPDIKMYL